MLTRKEVLTGGMASAFLVALTGSAHSAAAALGGKIVGSLPSKDTVWAWEEQLGRWAPCFTGNANHQRFTDWLGTQLEIAGIEPQKKSFGIPLWDPKKWTLDVDGMTVPTASYRPYSGNTGPEGVTADMLYVGKMPNIDLSNSRNKIVLVDIAAPGPLTDVSGGIDQSSPVWTAAGPTPAELKAAGALACVYMWNGIAEEDAMDQALPFNAPPGEVPGIWVGEKSSRVLKEAATKNSKLHFTLYAEVNPSATSDNVWGILPGMTDDIVIVNTHNDGCNAIEENGGLAVVALAQAVAKIPKEKRQKTYIFFTSTGHFAHGYHRGSTDWMKEHTDYLKKAVACLTIEHLGGTEWLDTGDAYKPTGRPQRSDSYLPTTPMQTVFDRAAKNTNFSRNTEIRNRFYWPGEGAQFSQAGIPSIAYMVVPNYLMTAPPGGEVHRLSKDRLYSEIQTFARCLEQLDSMSREEAYKGMEALVSAPKDRVVVGDFASKEPTERIEI